jgi:hypothetical protein
MALDDVAPVLAKEFVTLKLDFDRAKGAREIELRLAGKEQGLPWFAFVGPDGQPIVTSTGPKGNVGMPWAPEEVDHFQLMLAKAKRHLSDAEVAALIASIKEFRKKTEAK